MLKIIYFTYHTKNKYIVLLARLYVYSISNAHSIEAAKQTQKLPIVYMLYIYYHLLLIKWYFYYRPYYKPPSALCVFTLWCLNSTVTGRHLLFIDRQACVIASGEYTYTYTTLRYTTLSLYT